MFIEQEKIKLITQALSLGISEKQIEQLLDEQNVNDFYIENIKARLGIVDKKPERIRKPIKNQVVEEEFKSTEMGDESEQIGTLASTLL